MTTYTSNQKSKQEREPESGINISQIIQRARQLWYVFLFLPLILLGLAWLQIQRQVPI